MAKGLEQGIEQFLVKTEPFYAEVNGEIGLFKAAAASKMP
ncbi:MAG: AAA family ATPase, partial [Nitrospirae bacterium]|nr:AAA family ATPase [Nitrospirota bacterium]